jgi:hypothetical protein
LLESFRLILVSGVGRGTSSLRGEAWAAVLRAVDPQGIDAGCRALAEAAQTDASLISANRFRVDSERILRPDAGAVNRAH